MKTNYVTEPVNQLNEHPILVATKTQAYPKKSIVKVGPHCTLIVYQNGRYTGHALAHKRGFRKPLKKKQFSGLKKKLFGKEYLDVTLYWLHECTNVAHITGRVTTARGYAGTYDYYIEYHCHGFKASDFIDFFRKTKVATDVNKLIVSEELVQELVKERTNDYMKTLLDDLPNHHYDGSKSLGLSTYLDDCVSSIGFKFTNKIRSMP